MAGTPDLLLRTDQAVELMAINPVNSQAKTVTFQNYHFVRGGYVRDLVRSTYPQPGYTGFNRNRILGLRNGSETIKWQCMFHVRVDQIELRGLQELYWITEALRDNEDPPYVTVRDRRQLFGEVGNSATRSVSLGPVETNAAYTEYYADFDMQFMNPEVLFNSSSTNIGLPGPITVGNTVVQPSGYLREIIFMMQEGDKRT